MHAGNLPPDHVRRNRRAGDITDRATPRELGSYRTPRGEQFPPPDLGVYAPGRIAVRGEYAFVAWHSAGLRELDVAGDAPREVAAFAPPDRADPVGVLPARSFVTAVAMLEHGQASYAIITKIHGGLFVLEFTSGQ